MAALPAVTAANPPAIKPVFRSLLLFTPPLRAGSLFVRRSLMSSLLGSLADERPS